MAWEGCSFVTFKCCLYWCTALLQVAKECQRECRRSAMLSQKTMKDAVTRARRLSKEMQAYWKRFDKVEKEQRRKAEKEAMEQRKMDLEFREVYNWPYSTWFSVLHIIAY